jgi:pyruvate,orthophosphate dikinase
MKEEKKQKWVFMLDGLTEVKQYVGDDPYKIRALLGGKGASLASLSALQVPILYGFNVTTEACIAYHNNGGQFPEGLWEQVVDNIRILNEKTDKVFGDDTSPLLVSVRSGARVSMPGMLDAILNLGLTPANVVTMGEKFGDLRFAWDSYRRLIQMFGRVVLNVPGGAFEEIIEEIRKEEGVQTDAFISAEGWKKGSAEFKTLIKEWTGAPFPETPIDQLKLSIEAVFNSWNAKQAVDYRNNSGYPHDWGTAVNIVMMVFGNLADGKSGTGIVFTRNPSTGEKSLYGEYFLNTQTEEMVLGEREPKDIHEMEKEIPEAWRNLTDGAVKLERRFRKVQDIEFTIENGRLWILQTRNAILSAYGAIRIAVDMVEEGLITILEALDRERVTPEMIESCQRPGFDPAEKQVAVKQGRLLAEGLSASAGVAIGQAVFHPDTAELLASQGKQVILIQPNYGPNDVYGMLSAEGMVSAFGGATSHQAVVARQLGKPCITGCSDLEFDPQQKQFATKGNVVREGDWLSIDGGSGQVFKGRLNFGRSQIDDPYLVKFLSWSDKSRRLQIWSNADDPEQIMRARAYGAQGIGLCRTEYMFLGERTKIFQEYILTKDEETRQQKLVELEVLQVQDFCQIFEAGDGLPIVIRLLDPPLYEFLPARDELIVDHTLATARSETISENEQKLLNIADEMDEFNPLLGLRGSRVELVMPGIYQMQVRAIFKAACAVKSKGITVFPQIMLPMIAHVNEFRLIRSALQKTAGQILHEHPYQFEFRFGCMIETPRAALTAAEIAQEADFLSFGTNDLTQMTFGMSWDDAERHFLLPYVERGILPMNPFQTIDKDGVGQLMSIAIEGVRQADQRFEVGVCGAQAADPYSIGFFHEIGLDYISVSTFRIPVARLAAAQAAGES